MTRLVRLLTPIFLLAVLGAYSISLCTPPAAADVGQKVSSESGSISERFRVGPAQILESRTILKSGSTIYPPFVPLLHLDVEGKVHLLWHPWVGLLKEDAPPEKRVEHRTYDGVAWSPVEVVAGTERVRTMRGVEGSGSGFRLLWCEERGYYPDAHPERIYLQAWAAGRWADPEPVVIDADARPSCVWNDELGFAVDSEGRENIFWNDWREDHFFETLFTGEGQYPKTFYKVRSREGWSQAKKIHSHGSFNVGDFSVLSTGDSTLHLLWLESKAIMSPNGYNRVLHMVNGGKGWSGREKIAENRDDAGHPGLSSSLDSVADGDGTIHVAWIWSKNAGGSASENRLEVRELKQGQWGEPSLVSTSATGARWLGRKKGEAVLIFQEGESPVPIVPRDLGFRLYLSRIENGRFEGKTLISDETLSGMFDAVEDLKGRIHVVTVEVRQPGTADLVHRILVREE